jgi:hypothetical protein
MRKERRRLCSFLGIALVTSVLAMSLGFLSANAGAHNPCQEPGNLTRNCGFDTFADHWQGENRYQVPTGWGYYILGGDLRFSPSNDTYWGAPSLEMFSDGVPFTAGIYQQVSVTPGMVYQADAGWAAVSRPDFERKLGLDPTGGIDPLAATVMWGPSEWGLNSWPDLTVSTRATGPTMTVFVWAHHPKTYGDDGFYLDAVGLWPDPNQPAATVTPTPSPTATRKPPTRTPAPAPAMDTPTAIPSATPTETPLPTLTSTPTETPTPTPTATWTSTPTPAPPTSTPFPTRTPLPTVEMVARAVPTTEIGVAMVLSHTGNVDKGPESLFLYVAVSAFFAGILLAGILGWLWLRGRKQADGR